MKGPPTIEARDGESLAESAHDRRGEIDGLLSSTGYVLFRGFSVLSPKDFEESARGLISRVHTENPEHVPVDGTNGVQRPVAYSASRKLLWHSENCFNRSWPLRLMFACPRPAATGGETPLVDVRRVWQSLDGGVRDHFERRGIEYVRRYRDGLGLPWQQVLGTTDRAEAQRRAALEGQLMTWRPDGVAEARTHRPAVLEHPVTRDVVWFNQVTHWHPRCLDDATREVLLEIYGADGLPRDCRFADGQPIPDEVVDHILDVHASHEVLFPWAAGEVLLVDNALVAHGRNSYTGRRELLVAMGDMCRFAGDGATGVAAAVSVVDA
jgi:alpha-ketoglutarate-dependent taurine dioxygenase